MYKRKIGLFFGSFNPVHNGHMMLANYIVEYTDLDSVWFVVSPHNPFKDKKSLLDDHHRRDMLEMAIENDDRFEVCDIDCSFVTCSRNNIFCCEGITSIRFLWINIYIEVSY